MPKAAAIPPRLPDLELLPVELWPPWRWIIDYNHGLRTNNRGLAWLLYRYGRKAMCHLITHNSHDLSPERKVVGRCKDFSRACDLLREQRCERIPMCSRPKLAATSGKTTNFCECNELNHHWGILIQQWFLSTASIPFHPHFTSKVGPDMADDDPVFWGSLAAETYLLVNHRVYLRSFSELIHEQANWDDSSKESLENQRSRIIRRYPDSDIPIEWTVATTRVEPTAMQVDTILRPWRPDELRRKAQFMFTRYLEGIWNKSTYIIAHYIPLWVLINTNKASCRD